MSRVEEDEFLEWVVEEDFCRELEDEGWETLKADKIKRGWPDRICFGNGPQTVIVEFKRKSARARRGEKLQKYYRDLFEKMGYEVYLVTGKEEADELRTKLLARMR